MICKALQEGFHDNKLIQPGKHFEATDDWVVPAWAEKAKKKLPDAGLSLTPAPPEEVLEEEVQ